MVRPRTLLPLVLATAELLADAAMGNRWHAQQGGGDARGLQMGPCLPHSIGAGDEEIVWSICEAPWNRGFRTKFGSLLRIGGFIGAPLQMQKRVRTSKNRIGGWICTAGDALSHLTHKLGGRDYHEGCG
jgi:hypothetical protein